MNPEDLNLAFWSHWSDEPFAIFDNHIISRKEFLYQAVSLSKQLPDHQYVINLCKDRYLFALAFLAALFKKQTCLLPSNNAPQSINELIDNYADSYLLGDEENTKKYPRYHTVTGFKNNPVKTSHKDFGNLKINSDHLAVIAFTSGSTGKAKANPKFWWELVKETERTLLRFQNAQEQPQGILATVPPQHMYGLQTTILYPLLGKSALISGETFFPNDIKESLENLSFPAVFVTTPVHLRVCVQSGLDFPSIDMIISATAPLDNYLADQAERIFNCPVMEIFGSTETGAIASRRTVHSKNWFLFDQVQINQGREGVATIKGPQHKEWITLNDHVKIIDKQHFELLGRHSDMIKIAGKRASISDLSIKLNSIDGIIDGVIFQKENDSSKINRLCAFVIAPELTVKQINQALKEMIDPIFLPRPIIKVDHLPRNETGKLPFAKLQKLLSEYSMHG